MSLNEQALDMFEIMMSGYEEVEEACMCSSDEALIESLNRYGNVDMQYIVKRTGKNIYTVIYELGSIIFQPPELFENAGEYDPYIGWVMCGTYLSGNISKKLKAAQRMNERFPGKFERNIESLKRILPMRVDVDEIYLSLGATWVPAFEYAEFITEFLRLEERVDVIFCTDKWEIVCPKEVKYSHLNTTAYGVRDNYRGDWGKQYLTAIDIIEMTMNSQPMKVYDHVKKDSYVWDTGYEHILNREKTIEAQEKQNKIITAFRAWVNKSESRIKRFEKYYNDSLVGYAVSPFRGDILKTPGLNPEVKLYDYQLSAVERILFSFNNTLIAHSTGAGKSHVIVVSVHELYRLGLSKKNLVVVPNNVLKMIADTHRYLYKDDKILMVTPKDFAPKNRDTILEKIKEGDYTAIYMAYSTFDMIVMSKQYYVNKMENEIRELRVGLFNAGSKRESKRLEAQIKFLSKKLDEYIKDAKECQWMPFEQLGISTLVVDEAHNFRNIPIKTRNSGIVGMSGTGGSKKCEEMLEKAHNVDRLIFTTATPITNSISDLYAMQIYLQPEVLKYHNIYAFDTWVNTFGNYEQTIECDVNANSNNLRTNARFTSFHNLSELMALFSQVCDFHYSEESDQGFPEFNGYTDIKVPKNPLQEMFMGELSERTEKIRRGEVSREDDNLLKVTIDGIKAAVDIRLTDDKVRLPAGSKTKIDACVEKVYEFFKTPESVQIIFSDIGVPKDKFNVYDELKERLIDKGIPGSEIAYIHDAETEAAKTKLFEEMNNGTKRVVIGSTQKLGVGVNVQERLMAIHHLSVPWRPADMVQREGRILRRGNTSKEVFIVRYITEGSFDAYIWQILENKQRFISSFLSGTSAARDMDNFEELVLNYAEIKALAVGNPMIKKRIEVSNQLERIKILSRGRLKEMQELRVVTETLPGKISRLESLAEIALRDSEDYIKNRESVTNEERIAFGEELLEALKENILNPVERMFDEYQGFSVMLPENMTDEYRHVIIKSKNGGSYYCDLSGDKTALGCSKTMDYILEHLTGRAQKFSEEAKALKKQLEEAGADLEKENPYRNKLNELKVMLGEIDRELEENAKVGGEDK